MEFVQDREEWALKNVAYWTAPSSHSSSGENQKGRKSYEKKEAKVMAVKATIKEEPHFPPPRRWSPDHPWGRPCIMDECSEEHAPPSCAVFKSKTPEERLAAVRRRELCVLCFRHLDTKRCWSLGKLSNCNVRGSAARRPAERGSDDGERHAQPNGRAGAIPQVQADGGGRK